MKPAPFEYSLPTTIDEAIAALGEEAKVLAGGQSLIPLLALRLTRFDRLVDLRKIDELKGAELTNGHLRIGATTTQADAEIDAGVSGAAPLLAKALPHIGHFQIRNRGTIGGSIAHADPSAELPAVALALDATLDVAGPGGRRRIAAEDFFVSTFMTTLDDAEILTAVEIPVWGPGSGFAIEEMARRHGDFALVGALCGIQVDGGSITRAALSMFGVDSTPVRCTAAEMGLVGSAVDGLDVDAAGQAAVQDLDPPNDVHASAAYRRQVGATLISRALRSAIKEATDA